MNFSNIISYSLRVFNKSRVYSAINLLGLSLGLTIFSLIALFAKYEFGYDKHNANFDRIYRVAKNSDGQYLGISKSVIVAEPLAGAIKESVKEVDRVTRVARRSDLLVKTDNKSFFETWLIGVDPEYFDIFSMDVIAGEGKDLLNDASDVVLTESLAINYYGSATNAIGKTMALEQHKSIGDYVVKAVIRDIPFQAHFRPQMFLQFDALVRATQPGDIGFWNNNNYWIYLTMLPGTDVAAAEKSLNEYVKPYMGEKPPILFFQPLSDIHLGDRMNFDFALVGSKDSLYIFLSIGVLVLIIACINYINMATARAINRAKEIGVRKVNGALRFDLIVQFLAEAFISTLVSAVVALIAVALILPSFNQFVEREIFLDVLLQLKSVAFIALLLATVAIIAGSYPAFLFSSFKPIQTLRGTFRQSHNSRLRNVLVVFQFIVSGTLVFGTLTVLRQMEFVKNKDLGFVREHIILVQLRDERLKNKYSEIRELLLRNPEVKNVAASMRPPTGIQATMGRDWPGKNGKLHISAYHNQIDTNFVNLYQMKLVAGSNLTSTSGKNDAIVNEALVRELGYTNDEVVGKLFARDWDSTRIVGVVGDFHFRDFKLKIEPVDFKRFNWGPPDFLSIKIHGNNVQSTLDYIQKTLARISEKYPFEYTFYDEWYGKTFVAEQKTSKLMTAFASVAIIIAALGLYGLILHMVNQRMKEIGIRKTLGAGSMSIIKLLSGKFGVLILIGYVIACGIGYYGVTTWLDAFAYKISPGVSDFVITLLAIMIIAGVAVYSRIAVALGINPASVLKEN
jgi:putative ABC transport system permease protein